MKYERRNLLFLKFCDSTFSHTWLRLNPKAYSSELGLKVDKVCALRFITVIKTYDCNSSSFKREGSSFITGGLVGFE